MALSAPYQRVVFLEQGKAARLHVHTGMQGVSIALYLKDQSPSCVCIPSASMHQPVEMHAPTSAAMMPRAALPTATASRDQMLTSTLSWEPDPSSAPGSMIAGTRLVMKSLVRMVRPVALQQRAVFLC